MNAAKIRDVLNFISDELRELDLGTTYIPRITTPSSIEFLRDYVSPNKPVIITSATAHWPALSLWSNPTHLLSLAGSQPVTVAFTPNGRADAIVSHPNDPTKQYFALPYQQQMPLSSFLTLITNPTSSPTHSSSLVVPYLQQQNSSLTQELPQLLPDVSPHLPWANEAFSAPPDAVNIWIGDQRSVTSFHKDNYENLYAVITGAKTFYLYPPVDMYKMKLIQVEVAQWRPVDDDSSSNSNGEMDRGMELKLVPDASGRKVLWSSL
jgi:jumonji domain-containing protein 7